MDGHRDAGSVAMSARCAVRSIRSSAIRGASAKTLVDV